MPKTLRVDIKHGIHQIEKLDQRLVRAAEAVDE